MYVSGQIQNILINNHESKAKLFSFVDGYMSSFRKSGEDLEQLQVEKEVGFGLDDEQPTSTKNAAIIWLKTTLPQHLSHYSLPTPFSVVIAVLAVVGLVAAVVLLAYLVFHRLRATRRQKIESLVGHEELMLEAVVTRHSDEQDQDSARVTGQRVLEIDVIETRNEQHPLLPKNLPGIPGNQPDHVVGPVTKKVGTDESKV